MTLLSWHVVGHKIVCVNNGPLRSDTGRSTDAPELMTDRVYTIRRVRLSSRDGRVVICLEEVRIDEAKYIGYDAARFKPVRATSIESLLSLLTPTSEQVRDLADGCAQNV